MEDDPDMGAYLGNDDTGDEEKEGKEGASVSVGKKRPLVDVVDSMANQGRQGGQKQKKQATIVLGDSSSSSPSPPPPLW